MIVISAGLQKSGSGLMFNLTNDMVIASGGNDIRKIRQQHNLENILEHYNCSLSNLNKENINNLRSIHDKGYSFVVKTHNGPTAYIEKLIKKGIMKATCIYRDPRDVILSALDHGARIRDQGDSHTFASCSSIENTIPKVKLWLKKNIMKWIDIESVFLLKYEDLILNTESQLKLLSLFLGFNHQDIDFTNIISRYHISHLNDFQKDYLHFNKGIAGRFRTLMTKDEIAICNHELSEFISKLSYPLH